jgi:hypothetical protein
MPLSGLPTLVTSIAEAFNRDNGSVQEAPMTAAAEQLSDDIALERAPLELVVKSSADAGDHEAAQLAAERSVARAALIGAAIGMVICAGLWTVLVWVALAGSDTELGGALWMGAAVGVFAGIFFGGWVGTMVGAGHLDEVEQRSA